MVIGKPRQGYVTKFNIQYVGTQSMALLNYGNDPNKATVSLFLIFLQTLQHIAEMY